MTTKPAPRKHERQPKSRRSPRRRRAKQGSVAGRYGRPAKLRGLALGRPGGTRNRSGGSAGTSGGGPRAAPRAAPRGTPIENAPAVQPAKRKTALAKRLTQKQLNRVIGPLRARLAGCLKLHKVVGTASVRLVIQGSTGRVTAVLVAGCTSRDAAVRCMFARTRRVLFPRFTAPTQTSYTIRVKAP